MLFLTLSEPNSLKYIEPKCMHTCSVVLMQPSLVFLDAGGIVKLGGFGIIKRYTYVHVRTVGVKKKCPYFSVVQGNTQGRYCGWFLH